MKARSLLLAFAAFAALIPGFAQQVDELGDAYVSMYATVVWGPTNGARSNAYVTMTCYGLPTAQTTTLYRGAGLPGYSNTNRIGARMIPGVSYTVQLSVNNMFTPSYPMGPTGAPGFTLVTSAPPGYTIELDQAPRPRRNGSFNVWSQFSTVTVKMRLVVADRDAGLPAGTATSLRPAWTPWKLSLGSTSNGSPAGALAFNFTSATTSFASTFTRANLKADVASSEVVLLGESSDINVIRQVIAPQVCMEIWAPSFTSGQVHIKCYNSAQRSATVDGSGYYTFTGWPFAWYIVTPGATDAIGVTIENNVRETTTSGVNGTVAQVAMTKLTRTGSSPDYTWTAEDWHTGATALAKTWRSRSGTTENLERRESNDATVTRSVRTYTTPMFLGDEITSEVLGTTDPITTTYQFYSTDPTVAAYGNVKTVASSSGSWQGFEYSTEGLIWKTHGPWADSDVGVPAEFPTHSGVKTTATYWGDPFGGSTRPALVETTVNGTTGTKSNTTYTNETPFSSFTTHPRLTVVRADRTDYSSSTTSLLSKTKFFAEDVGIYDPNQSPPANAIDDFFRGQVHSVEQPGGVKQSFIYQRGTWNGTTFTVSGNAGLDYGTASRVIAISGTAGTGTLAPSESGYPFEAVYLVAGKSTKEVTIRNAYADTVRTESYAWSGSAWVLVGSVDFTWNYAHQLVSRVASNGATYTAVWYGDLKTSETDESGVTVSYTYDANGRVATAAKASGPTTTFTYNAAGQVLSQTVSAAGAGETIVTSASYADAGRLTSQTQPGMGATSHTYDVSARSSTVTLPVDNATRTETYYADGRLYSVTGTAVVPEFRHYTVEADGKRTEQVTPGYTGAPRWVMSWADWLGRTVLTGRPGFKSPALGNFMEEYAFDSTSGRLFYHGRTGYVSTRFEYDALGNPTRSGLDVVGSDGLILNSTDRITDSDRYFENFESAWWVRSETKTYPFDNNATPVTTSITRKQLTGHPTNRLDETRVTDAEGNTTVRAVDVNRAAATVTITTTRPGLTSPQVETIVNGLPVSVTSHDGLTASTQYDVLSRPWKSTDPRGKVTTTTYKPGSTLVASVADPLGNTVNHEYDNRGRRTLTTDAAGKKTRFGYNLRGQLTHQWGDGSYPVSFGYDDNFGDRISHSTYRSDTTTGDPTSWPSGTVGTADTTTFTFDAASGLLWKKTDAAGKFVEYDYNVRGQTASRKWSRTLPASSTKVTSTYAYDSNTGELTDVTYNDNGITPEVHYTYTRLGQLYTVTDATGSRTLNYNPAAPWRTSNETLDTAFYGSRILTHLYNEWSGTGGGYGQYTPGFVKGRYEGFELGVAGAGNQARDQHQNYTWANSGRFVGVNTRVTTGSPRDILYYYDITVNGSNSPLITRTETTSLSVARSYEDHRNVLTSIDSKWSGVSRTRFDYVTNNRYQRESAKQSGTAFADYGDSTFATFTYNARGELTNAPSYLGATADDTKKLPNRQHAYDYDSIGNRKSTNRTGNPSLKESYFGDTGGTQEGANNLNQYRSRENDSINLQGTADPAPTTVEVTGGLNPTTPDRQVRYWAAGVLVANSSSPWKGTLTIATTPSGGSTTYENRTAQIAKALEELTYDDDGNLTGDGMWNYEWDAENRLVKMTTTIAAALAGIDNRVLEFKYDYLGRRVQKRVLDGSTFAEISLRRFLYQGWNLIAELDSASALTRSFTWGLDLVGSLTATGGVGALLQICDHAAGKTLLPTYDGNGNVVSLIQAESSPGIDAGTAVATYEYDPFGRLLRSTSTGPSDFAKSNPFRFSTKFQDEESGLIYYGLRYYSPALGRFINRDPIEERGGLNLYGFCGNDGVNHWDYLGQSWFSKLFKKIGHAISKLWKAIKQPLITAVLMVISPPLAYAYLGIEGYQDGGWKGAFVNIASYWATQRIGAKYGHSPPKFDFANEAKRAIAHGLVNGTASAIMGGKFKQGFFAGAIGSFGGSLLGQTEWGRNLPGGEFTRNVIGTATFAGLGSKLGGGSFSRGFETGLMIGLFNHFEVARRVDDLVGQILPRKQVSGSPTRVGVKTDKYEVGSLGSEDGTFLQWIDAKTEVHGVGLWGQPSTTRGLGLFGFFNVTRVVRSGVYTNSDGSDVHYTPEFEYYLEELVRVETRGVMIHNYRSAILPIDGGSRGFSIPPEHTVGFKRAYGQRTLSSGGDDGG